MTMAASSCAPSMIPDPEQDLAFLDSSALRAKDGYTLSASKLVAVIPPGTTVFLEDVYDIPEGVYGEIVAIYDKNYNGPPTTCIAIRWARPFAAITLESNPQLFSVTEAPFFKFKFSPRRSSASNDYCSLCRRGERPVATKKQLSATSATSRPEPAIKKQTRLTGRIRRQAKATEIST